MKKRHFLKILLINLTVLSGVLGFVELTARLLFPELSNEVHKAANDSSSSGITRGLKFHKGKLNNITPLNRVPSAGKIIYTKEPLFLVIGDSISFGLGNSYEDIYWSRMQRKYNLDKRNKTPLKFISLGAAGRNLVDTTNSINNFTSDHNDLKIKYILYQFNYNDISPYTKELINKDVYKRNPLLNKKLSKFRNENLGRFTSITYLRILFKSFLRKTNGNCSERGIEALGQYTWSYIHKDFLEDSNVLWDEFRDNLKSLNDYAKSLNAELIVFISPILYDIDEEGKHKYYNPKNLDFSCGLIDPKVELKQITNDIDVDLLDPIDYVKSRFDLRVKEGNFEPFFFPGDENHFNSTGGEYIAEFLYYSIFK